MYIGPMKYVPSRRHTERMTCFRKIVEIRNRNLCMWAKQIGMNVTDMRDICIEWF